MRPRRGIRGATTADSNTQEAIVRSTVELLQELIKANDIVVDDIVAAIFTTTTDLNAEFPAVAARRIGWKHVALLCSHEMNVPDAQSHCIRVLILVNTDKPAKEITNLYLKEAANLRDRGTQDG